MANEKLGGADDFRDKVGADATDLPINSVMALELNDDRPLSPLVNAGPICSSSLVAGPDADDRCGRILSFQVVSLENGPMWLTRSSSACTASVHRRDRLRGPDRVRSS